MQRQPCPAAARAHGGGSHFSCEPGPAAALGGGGGARWGGGRGQKNVGVRLTELHSPLSSEHRDHISGGDFSRLDYSWRSAPASADPAAPAPTAQSGEPLIEGKQCPPLGHGLPPLLPHVRDPSRQAIKGAIRRTVRRGCRVPSRCKVTRNRLGNFVSAIMYTGVGGHNASKTKSILEFSRFEWSRLRATVSAAADGLSNVLLSRANRLFPVFGTGHGRPLAGLEAVGPCPPMSVQLSTLRRIIKRKSSVKNFKSSANPASPFPNKPTVENDPYPFPNVRYPWQCSEQHQSMRTNNFGNLWSSISIQGPLWHDLPTEHGAKKACRTFESPQGEAM